MASPGNFWYDVTQYFRVLNAPQGPSDRVRATALEASAVSSLSNDFSRTIDIRSLAFLAKIKRSWYTSDVGLV